MAGKNRWKEFAMFPRMEMLYRTAFGRYIDKHRDVLSNRYGEIFTDGDSMFRWWMEDETIPGQIELKDLFPEQFENTKEG